MKIVVRNQVSWLEKQTKGMRRTSLTNKQVWFNKWYWPHQILLKNTICLKIRCVYSLSRSYQNWFEFSFTCEFTFFLLVTSKSVTQQKRLHSHSTVWETAIIFFKIYTTLGYIVLLIFLNLAESTEKLQLFCWHYKMYVIVIFFVEKCGVKVSTYSTWWREHHGNEIDKCNVIIILVSSLAFSLGGSEIYRPQNAIYYQRGNDFGFSVHLQKNTELKKVTNFRLFVSAPKKNSLYVCRNTTCEEKDEKTSHEFLGMSIDGGDDFSEPVAICSPRYLTKNYGATGKCYVLNDGSVTVLQYFNSAFGQIKRYNNSNEYLCAHEEFGFSVRYVKDFETHYPGKSTLHSTCCLFGAPGVLRWREGLW